MTPRRIAAWSTVLLLLLVCVAVVELSTRHYDARRVEQHLRALAVPYQSVNVGVRGGSNRDIWIRILDRDGRCW
jgi:hypothetical protein